MNWCIVVADFRCSIWLFVCLADWLLVVGCWWWWSASKEIRPHFRCISSYRATYINGLKTKTTLTTNKHTCKNYSIKCMRCRWSWLKVMELNFVEFFYLFFFIFTFLIFIYLIFSCDFDARLPSVSCARVVICNWKNWRKKIKTVQSTQLPLEGKQICNWDALLFMACWSLKANNKLPIPAPMQWNEIKHFKSRVFGARLGNWISENQTAVSDNSEREIDTDTRWQSLKQLSYKYLLR